MTNMKMGTRFKKSLIFPLILYLLCGNISAWSQEINYENLTLDQAITVALQNNKTIQSKRLYTEIAKEKEKDVFNERLPEINFNATYSRLTNIQQYEQGLFDKPTTYDTYPGMFTTMLDASIPLYMGGRLKAQEGKSSVETHITELQTKKSEKDLRLEIITIFLQIQHYKEQERLIQEKIKEDSANITQVIALQKNGLVTKNEVLRANLQKSNHQLILTTVRNDIMIAEHRLLTTLSLPESTVVHINSEDLEKKYVDNTEAEMDIAKAYLNNEKIAIADDQIQLLKYDQKIVNSMTRPTLQMVGNYNFNNPNYRFFPPEPYFYRIGMIGVSGRYSISNLFKSKQKKQIVAKQISVGKLNLEDEKQQLNHQIFKAYNKLKEADEKIRISEEAIDQAKENYQIVRAKYANQLSLITELMDSDNTYLETQSNLISNKIDKQLKYYQLQYALGNL
jgi:outer membrane protein